MSVLPIAYYSNYYLVELYFGEFFNALGISYSGPAGAARILASKFEIKVGSEISKKLLVQGKPGYAVQDVPTPF